MAQGQILEAQLTGMVSGFGCIRAQAACSRRLEQPGNSMFVCAFLVNADVVQVHVDPR